jgi:glyoxylase-like metal-dependent hydrolase (beta-lactamase superfamily II)
MIKFSVNDVYKSGLRRGMFVLLPVLTMGFLLSSVNCSNNTAAKCFMMKLGHYEIITLLDASNTMKAELVKDADPALIKKVMPGGSLPASVNVFVIKTGNHTILVDTGFGGGGNIKGHLLKSMAKAGLRPDDIDIILLTHVHRDHAGGLTANGKAVFPGATLMLSKAELDSIDPAALKKMSASMLERLEPAAVAVNAYMGHITTFIPGAVLPGGIISVDLSGHTGGHTGYLIESEGKKLLISGDLILISAMQLPYPDVSLVYDADKAKSVAIRKAVLGRAADENIMLAGTHIIFPGIGQVIRDNNAFRFSPVR